MLRKLFILFISFFCFISADAQKKKGFNPQQFEAELEQFITIDACLTPQEASRIFPLYREMRRKQFMFMADERHNRYVDIDDDNACAEAIRLRDKRDLDVKKMQKEYHEKFLKILPASKVLRIIRSEDKFHRQIFKRVAKKDRRN
ncbi:MAG: hypothetical protein ACI3YB_03210 [Prevotella sp.]